MIKIILTYNNGCCKFSLEFLCTTLTVSSLKPLERKLVESDTAFNQVLEIIYNYRNGVQRYFQQDFSYIILVVNFIGGGNQSTRIIPLTPRRSQLITVRNTQNNYCKSTNFHCVLIFASFEEDVRQWKIVPSKNCNKRLLMSVLDSSNFNPTC